MIRFCPSAFLLLAWLLPSVQASTDPILVGVSNVQTGPSSSLGKDLLAGAEAYFHLVNSRGGVHGRPIQMIVKDDGYEPDPAVWNTFDLITRQHVFFLFGYVGTPTLTRVLPLLKYYEGEEIVNVAPFTGAEPQRKPPYDKFVFNIRASYQEETRRLVDYFYRHGCRRIGFFGQADAYGKSGESGVQAALQELGLTLVASVTYRRNTPFDSDMSAQVQLLRSRQVDAVVAVGVYGPCAAFIRDARLAGWNVPIGNISFVNASRMLDLLKAHSSKVHRDLTGNLVNSHVVPPPSDTKYPLVRQYREHVAPEAVDFVSLEGWLDAVVAIEALRRAGPDPQRKDFIRALESLGGWDPGIGSPLEFSSTNHQALHKVWLTEVRGGRLQPLEEPGSWGRLSAGAGLSAPLKAASNQSRSAR